MDINTHELAWAAGFFDGEGCTSINKCGRNATLLATQLSQNNIETLQRFKSAVGGLGKIYGPYTRKNHPISRKPYYTWSTQTFEKSQAVIAMLWGYLSPVKKLQAKSAMLKARN